MYRSQGTTAPLTMSDNYRFDPKLLMKLTEINDEAFDFDQFDFNKINSDVNDKDLLVNYFENL